MAVCLATTTGDEVDDDIVELVREDDEVGLLNRAVTTSYSPSKKCPKFLNSGEKR